MNFFAGLEKLLKQMMMSDFNTILLNSWGREGGIIHYTATFSHCKISVY
jgi:hypothetical protein